MQQFFIINIFQICRTFFFLAPLRLGLRLEPSGLIEPLLEDPLVGDSSSGFLHPLVNILINVYKEI